MTVRQRLTTATSFRVLIGLGVAALLVFAGYGFARAASGGDTINGCVSASGALRVVNDGASCRPAETPISWNSAGQEGPAGPAGADGPAAPLDPQQRQDRPGL